jgi:hypothetical protein
LRFNQIANDENKKELKATIFREDLYKKVKIGFSPKKVQAISLKTPHLSVSV